MGQRVVALGRPGGGEGGQAHVGERPLCARGSATDFTGDDQRADGALGQVIVGRRP